MEGDIGGTQHRNTERTIVKYRVQNRRNTDTAFMIGHVLLQSLAISHVCHLLKACMHQKSTLDIVRKHEKTLNDQYKEWKARSLPLSLKYLNFINLFTVVLVAYCIDLRQESANEWYRNTVKYLLLPNTVNEKGENHKPQG